MLLNEWICQCLLFTVDRLLSYLISQTIHIHTICSVYTKLFSITRYVGLVSMYLCTALYVGVVIRLLECVGHFKHVCVYSQFALCVDVSGILKPACLFCKH